MPGKFAGYILSIYPRDIDPNDYRQIPDKYLTPDSAGGYPRGPEPG